MPSLVEKMQPWTQTHFMPESLLRRSWSTSSSSVSTPLTTSSSTTSLLSRGSSSNSGDSVLMMGSSESSHVKKSNSGGSSPSTSPSLPARAGGGAKSGSFLGKICSGRGGGEGGNSSNCKNSSSNENVGINNNNNCNGSRPKRKTPILSTCMSNWVKFDHDCQKPLPCSECESNQEKNRKVLFTSGGNVLINTGKGKHHHHRHSHHFFSNSSNSNDQNSQRHSTSLSEPTSPVDSGNASGPSSIDSNNSAFSGEVLSWENGKNKSSFKIVINVPFLDMNVFQNENVEVEIVCNKNKLATGKDFELVQRNRTELKYSGWYWESIDSETSMEILESAQPGAFIIRDSSDPRFLYSLSVQTERGPTSVRLTYRNGRFSLDADEKLAELLPKFDSVIRLIEHYVNGGTKVGKQVWVDPKGNMHSTVKLTKPMRKDVGSLKHLARVAINKYGLLNNTSSCSSSSSRVSVSPAPPNPVSFPIAPASVVSSSSSESCSKRINPVPNANASGSRLVHADVDDERASSAISNITTPVADLSKLPMSLQNYLLEYPYNL